MGEFDGVKTYINSKIEIPEHTTEQKAIIKHIEITNYQNWEPYYKTKNKTHI